MDYVWDTGIKHQSLLCYAVRDQLLVQTTSYKDKVSSSHFDRSPLVTLQIFFLSFLLDGTFSRDNFQLIWMECVEVNLTWKWLCRIVVKGIHRNHRHHCFPGRKYLWLCRYKFFPHPIRGFSVSPSDILRGVLVAMKGGKKRAACYQKFNSIQQKALNKHLMKSIWKFRP